MPRYLSGETGSPVFADDFADLLPDLITISLPASRNSYGEATFAPPRTYAARVMYKSTARRTQTTSEFISPLQCIVSTSTLIPLDATVTLPDLTTHIVRDSELFRDETNTPHHVTVYFAA